MESRKLIASQKPENQKLLRLWKRVNYDEVTYTVELDSLIVINSIDSGTARACFENRKHLFSKENS